MVSIMRAAAIAVLCLLALPAFGAEDCGGQARTDMEKAYCQVKAAGFAAALPSLREFRKNPEKTQRLLLRRPAARAGVALPAGPALPAPAPQAAHSAEPRPEHPPCQLHGERINCGERRYALLGNRPNSQLDAGALTSANRLQLAGFAGGDRDALMAYLDDSYQRYLEAMISVGLAASTMSFTKFYHTYSEVAASDGDFAARMATMFEYLKKDKQTMAVSAHPTSERPTDIAMCRTLNPQTIVCDDVKHNWIFRADAS